MAPLQYQHSLALHGHESLEPPASHPTTIPVIVCRYEDLREHSVLE